MTEKEEALAQHFQKTLDIEKKFDALKPSKYQDFIALFVIIFILPSAWFFVDISESENIAIFFTPVIISIYSVIFSQSQQIHKRIDLLAELVKYQQRHKE